MSDTRITRDVTVGKSVLVKAGSGWDQVFASVGMMTGIRARVTTLPIFFLVFNFVGCGGTQEPEPEEGATSGAPVLPVAKAPLPLRCQIDGADAERYRRDCDEELEAVEGQVAELLRRVIVVEEGAGTRLTKVRAALSAIAEHRRQLCQDWNVCGVTRSEHVARADWLADELRAFDGRLPTGVNEATDARELELWAEGLEERRSSSRSEGMGTETPAQASKISDEAAQQPSIEQMATDENTKKAIEANRQRLLVVMKQQEREIEEYRDMLKTVEGIRAKTKLGGKTSRPRSCIELDGITKSLNALVRGENSGIGNMAGGLSNTLSRFCGRFERWDAPTDRDKSAIKRLVKSIDRARKRVAALEKCLDPGPYNKSCTNRFGPAAGAKSRAKKISRALEQAKDELNGVAEGQKRYPCDKPIWDQLEAWAEEPLKRDIKNIGSGAHRHCDAVGVSEKRLSADLENFNITLDAYVGTCTSSIRIREESVIRLRPYVEKGE